MEVERVGALFGRRQYPVEHAEPGGPIRIEVRDTGSGVSADALPRVFDRFYRADPARSRNSGSAGLGLAIVQQIASLHGGNVEIASDAETGTTVLAVLPQPEAG